MHNLTIYSHTSINEAYLVTESQAREFIESEEFKTWVKIQESEQKLQVDIANRLNGVISAIGGVIKGIGSLGRLVR